VSSCVSMLAEPNFAALCSINLTELEEARSEVALNAGVEEGDACCQVSGASWSEECTLPS